MMNTFLSWSLSIYLIVADPEMTVFSSYSISASQQSSIQSMVTALNNYGTPLVWDGLWTSDESTLITRVDSGDYQVLLALNPDNSYPIWSTLTQMALEIKFDSASNSIQQFIIWDRFCNINPNAPGMNGLVTRQLTTTICPIIDGVPPSTGPQGEVGCWVGNYASHGSFGVISFTDFLGDYPEGLAYYAEDPSENPTHVHYCFSGVNVMYSTTPMDFYLDSTTHSAWAYFVNSMDLLLNSDLCAPDYSDCPQCVSDCQGMASGNYPSCDADGNNECDSAVYATCSNGYLYDNRPCPATTVWNQFMGLCVSHSSCPCSGGDNTPERCGLCVDSCTNVDDGDYASCSADCGVYASCSGGVLYDERPCPGGLVWNDAYKICTQRTLCPDSACFIV